MYGFVLQGIAESVTKKFGENVWNEIIKKIGLKTATFHPQKTYSETVVPRIIKASSDVTGRDFDKTL